jgi:hypothetical protein
MNNVLLCFADYVLCVMHLYNCAYQYRHCFVITAVLTELFILVPSLMYGFGDGPSPLEESVEVMDVLTIEYIKEMVYIYVFVCNSKCPSLLTFPLLLYIL